MSPRLSHLSSGGGWKAIRFSRWKDATTFRGCHGGCHGDFFRGMIFGFFMENAHLTMIKNG